MFIEIKDLYHVFNPDTPLEKEALSGVNLKIDEGEFIALVGETGSGKTTLVLHLNGLLLPTRGSVRIGDFVLTPDTKKVGKLRDIVGIVFQYPEHQLFEESVYGEISFGLKNRDKKLPDDEIEARVKNTARLVNLDIESLGHRSPFTLSGGEQRKVAIASILAVDPKILIFDEPTQGLDAESKAEILKNIKALNEGGKTVIIISHDLEEVVGVSNRVVILKEGKTFFDVRSSELFSNETYLKEIRNLLPDVTELLIRLKEKGWKINTNTYKARDALNEILQYLRKKPTETLDQAKKG